MQKLALENNWTHQEFVDCYFNCEKECGNDVSNNDTCDCPDGNWSGIINVSAIAGVGTGILKGVSVIKCDSNGLEASVDHLYHVSGIIAGFGGGIGMSLKVTNACMKSDLKGPTSGSVWGAGLKLGLSIGYTYFRSDVENGAKYRGHAIAIGKGLGIPVTGIYLWGVVE